MGEYCFASFRYTGGRNAELPAFCFFFQITVHLSAGHHMPHSLKSFKAKTWNKCVVPEENVALQVSDILMADRLNYGLLLTFHCFTPSATIFNFDFRREISIY